MRSRAGDGANLSDQPIVPDLIRARKPSNRPAARQLGTLLTVRGDVRHGASLCSSPRTPGLRGLRWSIGASGWRTRHVDKRVVEIARALATQRGLLLLDEPARGLGPCDIERLGKLLRQVADADIAVVLVEHHMPLVMSLSDQSSCSTPAGSSPQAARRRCGRMRQSQGLSRRAQAQRTRHDQPQEAHVRNVCLWSSSSAGLRCRAGVRGVDSHRAHQGDDHRPGANALGSRP